MPFARNAGLIGAATLGITVGAVGNADVAWSASSTRPSVLDIVNSARFQMRLVPDAPVTVTASRE